MATVHAQQAPPAHAAPAPAAPTAAPARPGPGPDPVAALGMAPGGGLPAAQAVMAAVDAIGPGPGGLLRTTYLGREITMTPAQAEQVRAGARRALDGALRKCKSRAEGALGRYQAQEKVDAEFPVTSRVAGAWAYVRNRGDYGDPGGAVGGLVLRSTTQTILARGAITSGEFSRAVAFLAEADAASERAAKLVTEYVDKKIGAAEGVATGLEYTSTAAFITLGVLAVVVTGGAALGAAPEVIGVGIAGTSLSTTVTAISVGAPIVAGVGTGVVQAALGDKVDWTKIAVQAAIDVVIARFGGKLTQGVLGRLAGNPATQTLARQALGAVLKGVAAHELSQAFTSIVHNTVDALRGRQVTWSSFLDDLAHRLTDPKGLFIAVAMSGVHLGAEVKVQRSLAAAGAPAGGDPAPKSPASNSSASNSSASKAAAPKSPVPGSGAAPKSPTGGAAAASAAPVGKAGASASTARSAGSGSDHEAAPAATAPKPAVATAPTASETPAASRGGASAPKAAASRRAAPTASSPEPVAAARGGAAASAPKAATSRRGKPASPAPKAESATSRRSGAAASAPKSSPESGGRTAPSAPTRRRAARSADRNGLPPDVRSSPYRRKAMKMIDSLSARDRALFRQRLAEMPPEEAGELLTNLGKSGNKANLKALLAERRAGPPDEREGPAGARSGLDDSAEHHIDPDDGLQVRENRPPARVSEERGGVNRSNLKRRMTRPDWAESDADWNPHHVIPVSLENHPVLDALRATKRGWDNNAAVNGYPLPTRPGIEGAEHLPVHQVTGKTVAKGAPPRSGQTARDLGGHPIWNDKVRARLDALEPLMSNPTKLRTAVLQMIADLKKELETAQAQGRPVLF